MDFVKTAQQTGQTLMSKGMGAAQQGIQAAKGIMSQGVQAAQGMMKGK
jgi:hypothetical protein